LLRSAPHGFVDWVHSLFILRTLQMLPLFQTYTAEVYISSQTTDDVQLVQL